MHVIDALSSVCACCGVCVLRARLETYLELRRAACTDERDFACAKRVTTLTQLATTWRSDRVQDFHTEFGVNAVLRARMFVSRGLLSCSLELSHA